KTRSNIKKIDRLMSNQHLQEEYFSFYKVMASSLINEGSHPKIHIDWSCLCSLTKLYVLRASLSMPGRSIVIYEECHPKKNDNNHSIHKAFLNNLKDILPVFVRPVIVTDAGFRAPWFAEVLAMGWDFVGRLRNENLICFNDNWELSKSLYAGANNKPTYLGQGVLTKKLKVPAHLILYKGKKKNRHKLKNDKTRSNASKSKRYSRSHKEPWLLVTSLSSTVDIAKQTINIYHGRMRIEENFRDTKCPQYGFGLKESRSRSPERMKILLLIAAIATFACWLAAIVTRETKAAADFQAHSSKFKSVLSSVFLGREALKKGIKITQEQLIIVFQRLLQMANEVRLEIPKC
ncbi:MAG: IS4 family transposase, partial [Acinetobacter sp.]|nr:IS4 family transposase [Acinetobacter sp.]